MIGNGIAVPILFVALLRRKYFKDLLEIEWVELLINQRFLNTKRYILHVDFQKKRLPIIANTNYFFTRCRYLFWEYDVPTKTCDDFSSLCLYVGWIC